MYQDAYRPPTQFSVFPPVIKNLLILNALFYLAKYAALVTQTAVLAKMLNAMALYSPGAPEIGFSIFGGRGEIMFWPWQVVTYSFLHGDLGHLFFNMFALWMFGVKLENFWGSKRFAIYYFVCVVGAALVHLPTSWGAPYPTLGASGGVFGILLAFGMIYPRDKIWLYFLFPIEARWFVIMYGALELYAGITGAQDGIAHAAHLGGMLFGWLLLLFWRGRLPIKPGRVMYW
jgi:membrane associated rhomboid family serine protease